MKEEIEQVKEKKRQKELNRGSFASFFTKKSKTTVGKSNRNTEVVNS